MTRGNFAKSSKSKRNAATPAASFCLSGTLVTNSGRKRTRRYASVASATNTIARRSGATGTRHRPPTIGTSNMLLMHPMNAREGRVPARAAVPAAAAAEVNSVRFVSSRRSKTICQMGQMAGAEEKHAGGAENGEKPVEEDDAGEKNRGVENVVEKHVVEITTAVFFFIYIKCQPKNLYRNFLRL